MEKNNYLKEICEKWGLYKDPLNQNLKASPESSHYLFFDEQEDILKLGVSDHTNFSPIFIDWIRLWKRFKKNKNFRKDPLYKALGSKGQKDLWAIDTTCGLGKDSMLLLYYGFKVWAIERSKLVSILIEDAIRRASKDKQLSELLKKNFKFIPGDAQDILLDLSTSQLPEVIYLDPMYQDRARHKALAAKEMRILHDIHGDDKDSQALLKIALMKAKSRVVVKRAIRDHSLQDGVSFSYLGKSTRYDMYRII